LKHYVYYAKKAFFGGAKCEVYNPTKHCVKYPIPQCNALNMTIHFQLDEAERVYKVQLFDQKAKRD